MPPKGQGEIGSRRDDFICRAAIKKRIGEPSDRLRAEPWARPTAESSIGTTADGGGAALLNKNSAEKNQEGRSDRLPPGVQQSTTWRSLFTSLEGRSGKGEPREEGRKRNNAPGGKQDGRSFLHCGSKGESVLIGARKKKTCAYPNRKGGCGGVL